MRTRQQRTVALALVLCLAGICALELAASVSLDAPQAPRRSVAVMVAVAPHAHVRVSPTQRVFAPARMTSPALVADGPATSALALAEQDEPTLRERLARLTTLRI